MPPAQQCGKHRRGVGCGALVAEIRRFGTRADHQAEDPRCRWLVIRVAGQGEADIYHRSHVVLGDICCIRLMKNEADRSLPRFEVRDARE